MSAVGWAPPTGVVKNSWYGKILAGAGRSIREGHLSCDVITCRPNASPLQLSATNDYQLHLTTPTAHLTEGWAFIGY
ncbi:MAG: hypothetical protein GDA56_00470 [Hormoscilla sp. GM7CHS1pb]|nr:hypothetical protein [Hormoscilla sp. GM7CHS1pb]